MIPLLVALGGGAGAATRFLADTWLATRLRARLPAGTIIVNVTGSLLLGLVVGWALNQGGGSDVKAVIGTGFLGGYTTFSTASVEAVRLARGGRGIGALVHAVAMLLFSLLAASLGLWLTGF